MEQFGRISFFKIFSKTQPGAKISPLTNVLPWKKNHTTSVNTTRPLNWSWHYCWIFGELQLNTGMFTKHIDFFSTRQQDSINAESKKAYQLFHIAITILCCKTQNLLSTLKFEATTVGRQQCQTAKTAAARNINSSIFWSLASSRALYIPMRCPTL